MVGVWWSGGWYCLSMTSKHPCCLPFFYFLNSISGISNFNLGATSHRGWLKSEKRDSQAYRSAEHYYTFAINIAREQWIGLNQSDSEDQWSRNNSMNSNTVTVNIEMTEGKGNHQRRQSNAPGQKNNHRLKGVSLGASGHDIADRLSGRLYQLGQLYFDNGTEEGARAAEPLIQEALRIDEQTNNVLGYAKRVGLLCRIWCMMNRYSEANAKITDQLNILRQRLINQEEMDDEEPLRSESSQHLQRSNSERNRAQERDELFQALQHCLKDAAIVQTCSRGGDTHLAMRYFIESLSCAPTSEPYLINSTFRALGEMIDNSNVGELRLSPQVLTQIHNEVKLRGSGSLPKDMAFVIDYSGSMSGGKMKRARDNTNNLILSQLTPNDRGSVIQFNSKVSILTPQMVPKESGMLKEAVDSMRNPNSGTALWDAIGAAYDQLEFAANQNQTGDRGKWIIVVTDGEDNKSRTNSPHTLHQRIQRGQVNIIILAVGVSQRSAQQAMQQVAAGNDGDDSLVGELISIDDSAKLDAAFATIASMIGDHVRVEQH